MKKLILSMFLMLILPLQAFAVEYELPPADEPFTQQVEPISDPIEPFNRVMFQVNDKLYYLVINPVAHVIRHIIPEPVRDSVSNAYSNLLAPIRIGNCLFQGKLVDAGDEFSRFSLNSTVGILGLFDPAAKYFDLPEKNEDMGQTFGSYGIDHGFYIVLPIIGPTSFRDGMGDIGDIFMNPLTYLVDWDVHAAIRGGDIVNYYSLNPRAYESIVQDSIDPYTTVKDAYTQYRKALVEK
jgi:phospholipid-binding lipoprotein MlaA